MRYNATRAVLAAALVCGGLGLGCNDLVKVAPGDPEPPAGEVWGRLLDSDGVPMGDAPPLWIGEQGTTVAADGTFRFTGVHAPYDLVIGLRNLQPTDDHDIVFYEGVTCNKPVARMQVSHYEGYGGSGWVTGRVPYAERGQTRIIVVTSDGRAEYTWADNVSTAYALRVRWGHGETNRVTMYVLRYDRSNVLQDHYTRSFSLRDDERRVLDLDHVTFTPASTVFLNGSIRAEPYTSNRWVNVYVNFGRNVIDIGTMQVNARFPDAFSMDIPYFPGAVYEVEAHASWNGESAYSSAVQHLESVRPGSPVHATLRPGPQMISPPNGAADVDMGETLRWQPQGGLGVYRLRIRGYSNGWGRTVQYYTTRSTIVLTEIPALQGLMRPGTQYYWSVEQLPEFGTVDDVLAGGDPEANRSWSADFQFSTAAATP